VLIAVMVLFVGSSFAAPAVGQTAPPPSPTPITVPPVVTLGADAVTVEGITKTASAVVFGVARRSLEFGERLETRFDLVEDTNNDGAIRFEVAEGLPWKSVWAAVDLTTGEFTLAVPEGFPLLETPFPGQGIGSALNTLETAGDFEQLLWVRPALGAWALTVGDGGVNDGDGEGNHRILADVSRFTAVGKSPAAPDKFAPGDVLVGVEAHTLNVFAARLAH
jgi:hypothetical protein